jgi:hypothetical protein
MNLILFDNIKIKLLKLNDSTAVCQIMKVRANTKCEHIANAMHNAKDAISIKKTSYNA